MNPDIENDLPQAEKDKILTDLKDQIYITNLATKYALNRAILAAAIKADTVFETKNWAVYEEQREIERKLKNCGFWIYVDGEHVTLNICKDYLDAYL